MNVRVWLLLLLVFATLAVQFAPTHTTSTSLSAALRDGGSPLPAWHDGNMPFPPWHDGSMPAPPWQIGS